MVYTFPNWPIPINSPILYSEIPVEKFCMRLLFIATEFVGVNDIDEGGAGSMVLCFVIYLRTMRRNFSSWGHVTGVSTIDRAAARDLSGGLQSLHFHNSNSKNIDILNNHSSGWWDNILYRASFIKVKNIFLNYPFDCSLSCLS